MRRARTTYYARSSILGARPKLPVTPAPGPLLLPPAASRRVSLLGFGTMKGAIGSGREAARVRRAQRFDAILRARVQARWLAVRRDELSLPLPFPRPLTYLTRPRRCCKACV